ncbi:MAG: hypothetical protein JSW68_07660, partial [Burkholderiales bacterium]
MILRRESRTIATWVLCLLIGIGAVVMLTRHLAENHLRGDAELTALRYADVIAASVPALDSLFAGDRPQPETLAQLRRLRAVGEIFRFKLFDRQGHTILVSDDLERTAAGHVERGETIAEHQGAANRSVQQIVLGGRNHIALKSGAGIPDRPPVYSEAYVPVMRDGSVIGVVEVYVDQSTAAASVRNEYHKVAVVVAALVLVFGALATWHWMQRLGAQRRAEERVDYLAQHDMLSGALNR